MSHPHLYFLFFPVSAALVMSKVEITGGGGCVRLVALPVLRSVGQRDDDILVDEDEEGQEEAQAHGAEDVHRRQTLERSHVEDGTVVNFKHRDCSKKKRRKR